MQQGFHKSYFQYFFLALLEPSMFKRVKIILSINARYFEITKGKQQTSCNGSNDVAIALT